MSASTSSAAAARRPQHATVSQALVLVKLGGSLITDKTREATPRLDIIDRMAAEIAKAHEQKPSSALILGHGSGSFGHPVAARYGVERGHLRDWHGYAETAAAAQRLNRLVADALLRHGVPAVSVQPSASARALQGRVVALDSELVRLLLGRGLVPLLYGDVALDEAQGCAIISTEEIFCLLARRLRPSRLIEVGEVEGVYAADSGAVIDRIDERNAAAVLASLGQARGVDVTGGMVSKVRLMLEMARSVPGLDGRIISGLQPGLLTRVLVDPHTPGGTVVALSQPAGSRAAF